MATGALDPNGVWMYGEDDARDTFSELLNVGQDSTSDAIGLDRARITALEQKMNPAAWTVIVTGIVYRVWAGLLVEVRSDNAYSGSYPDGDYTLPGVVVPAGIRPTTRRARGAAYMSGGYPAVATIYPDGTIIITQRSGGTRTTVGFSVLYFLG